MYTQLHPRFANSAAGTDAQALTKACVHCGFCLSTCPTYLDSRDERDSPRGRIYLINQLLENGSASDQTQLHLDRCLTCRHCETACPSGMKYGELLDIGRHLMEQEAPRPAHTRLVRWLLRTTLSRPTLIAAALAAGHILRPLLPKGLRRKLPPRQRRAPTPTLQQPRKMLLLEGCVQRAATPNTNDAARRVLDRLGITLVTASKAGCCGALSQHLAAPDDALNAMRRNIDAWWPHIAGGAEAVISSATGCGAMLADYGRLLANDQNYADKAQRVTELSRDLAEILLDEDLDGIAIKRPAGKVSVHTPCTLQHALRQPELLVKLLTKLGFDLAEPSEKLLCCGSAGTYSLLQPAISERLRDNTLRALTDGRPAVIATANIGCQLHLQAAAGVPVVHWIELLDHA